MPTAHARVDGESHVVGHIEFAHVHDRIQRILRALMMSNVMCMQHQSGLELRTRSAGGLRFVGGLSSACKGVYVHI